jgi:hypothetical protein
MNDDNESESTHRGETDSESTATRSADGEGAPAPSSSDGSKDKSRFSRKLFVAMFIGIGGLGVLAYALFGGSNDDDTTTESVASPPPNTATVADDFARPDNIDTLGTTITGQLWEAPAGTWGLIDQQAHVATPNANESGRSWAVTDLGSGNGSVTATAATMAQGWGIVFRYRGPFNYWMLQASTEYATYNLVKVVDGELESVAPGGIGLAPIRDGTKVGVEFQGPAITIMLDDQSVAIFRDPHLQNATKVGMIVSPGGVATARWDDFTAQAAPPSAVGAEDGGG